MYVPNRWSVGISPESEVVAAAPRRYRTDIKRVGVQYDTFGYGGAERVAAELVKIYVELGYEVCLYTNVPAAAGDNVLPDCVERKVAPSCNDDHEARFAFWQAEVENGLDACIYNSWVSGWAQFDCWSLKSLGVQFIFYTHSTFASWFRDPIADYLARALPWIAARADAVVAINGVTADFFSLYSKKVMQLVNPVDQYLASVPVSEYSGTGQNILWVGRISDEKRPYEAVQIMAQVCKTHPEAHMDVLGGNPDPDRHEPERIARYASEVLGLTNNQITFHDFSDPFPFYGKADVYLQTSECEGFALTLAEAMRFGLPCVTYDLSYLTLLESGEGALMAPIGDIKAAARRIESILDDDATRAATSKAALRTYDAVCRVDVAAMWRAILAELPSGSLPADLLHSPDHEASSSIMRLVLEQVGIAACDARREHHALEKAEARISQLQAEAAESREKIDRLRSELAGTRAVLACTRRERDDACSSLSAIRGSRSFKLAEAIAAPYRRLKNR